MVWLAIVILLAGVILAQRGKVLSLISACALVLLLTICVGTLLGQAPSKIAVTILFEIAFLQFCYLIGLGVRHALLMVRGSRLRGTLAESPLEKRQPIP